VARKVDINPETVKCLQRFVRIYSKGSGPQQPLLVSERDNRLSYMSLYSKVKNIGKKAGIGSLHPNMLRRTYLVRLYQAEGDLRLVQQQAGHASPKTTALYVRPRPDRQPPPQSKETVDLSAAEPKDDSLKAAEPAVTCEACGRPVLEAAATKIDSGQILCHDCLDYLRSE
jgi:hypothetical protein